MGLFFFFQLREKLVDNIVQIVPLTLFSPPLRLLPLPSLLIGEHDWDKQEEQRPRWTGSFTTIDTGRKLLGLRWRCGGGGEGGSIFCQSAGFEAERSHVWAALWWLWATGGHWCWRPCQWITSSFFLWVGAADQSERGRGSLSRASRLWNRSTLRRWRWVCVWNARQFAAV